MDAEIIREAIGGNRDAQEILLAESQSYVRAVISRNWKPTDRTSVDDLTQIALLKIWLGMETCLATDWQSFLGWAAGIARRVVLSEVRDSRAKCRDARRESVGLGFEPCCGNDSALDWMDEIEYACEVSPTLACYAQALGDGLTGSDARQWAGVSACRLTSERKRVREFVCF